MAERPVALDLRMPAGQTQGDRAGSMPGGTARQPPDQEAAARFAQSLKGVEGVPAPAQASVLQAANPFSLFGRATSGSASSPATSPAMRDGEARQRGDPVETIWDRTLQDGVKRLMVAEDQRSLRMDLDASVFPGVVVEVFEDAGAWVAQFTCSESDSFDRLAAAAEEMAPRMAASLERDALWRVLAESTALGERTPVEAFSSAPGGGIR